MNLQYISDSNGNKTGVFIPIKDWERLKKKFKELEEEESQSLDVPEWHKDIIRERIEDYKINPGNVIDWDEAKDKFNIGE